MSGWKVDKRMYMYIIGLSEVSLGALHSEFSCRHLGFLQPDLMGEDGAHHN